MAVAMEVAATVVVVAVEEVAADHGEVVVAAASADAVADAGVAVSVEAVVVAAGLTAAEAVVVAVGADSEVPGAVTVAGEAVDLPHTEQVLPKVDAKLPSSQITDFSVLPHFLTTYKHTRARSYYGLTVSTFWTFFCRF